MQYTIPELVQRDVVIDILKVPEVYVLAIISKAFSDFLHRRHWLEVFCNYQYQKDQTKVTIHNVDGSNLPPLKWGALPKKSGNTYYYVSCNRIWLYSWGDPVDKDGELGASATSTGSSCRIERPHIRAIQRINEAFKHHAWLLMQNPLWVVSLVVSIKYLFSHLSVSELQLLFEGIPQVLKFLREEKWTVSADIENATIPGVPQPSNVISVYTGMKKMKAHSYMTL